MTQPPAAEVRRRGDRIRRRRQALTVAGGALAVALVVTPIGLLARGGDTDDLPPVTQQTGTPSPSPHATVAPGEIPDDFPLADGLPKLNQDGSPVRVADRATHALTFCGATAWSPVIPAPLDTAAVESAQPEDIRVRYLATYADEATARQVVATYRQSVEACPTETIGGTEQVYTVSVGRLGDEAVVVAQRYRAPGAGFDTGLDVMQVVRVGSAVLLTSDYGEAGSSPESVRTEIRYTDGELGGIAAAMTELTAPSSPSPSTSPDATPTVDVVGLGDIPAGFPLGVDLHAMTGDGGKLYEPAADAPGLENVQVCGEPIWTARPQGRMGARATGPEYADERELRVYATADDAVAELAALRSRLASCPSEPVEGGISEIHHVFDASTGYDSVTWGDSYEQGLGGGLRQVTRVGRAIVATASEGETSAADLAQRVAPQTELTRTLAGSLCVFTAAGC